MLGDVAQWQSSPRTGYDAIANAIDTSDAQASAVGKLAGSLPRVVAYMRLALTRANSPAEASGYLQRAATDSSAAVAAAGK